MYPLYWTSGKEGIFMRYSYEFKLLCVDLYKQGLYPDTPDGIGNEAFHKMVRNWVRIEASCGSEALKHKNHNKTWTAEERYSLVIRVLNGESLRLVALSAGINPGLLHPWVRKFKIFGYNGLVNCKPGRRALYPNMRKKNNNTSRELSKSEYEELVRLRAEVEYIKAENEIIKKCTY